MCYLSLYTMFQALNAAKHYKPPAMEASHCRPRKGSDAASFDVLSETTTPSNGSFNVKGSPNHV
jgi:hypothetical protein